ncbi:MAG: DNA polymerase III subunit delta [Zoogloeaceae bacterium]|jgi:DNA polymerase-3 subunit delta|nr:DNA polymerase III subunit delta [Zoogloeaceae bacterium]
MELAEAKLAEHLRGKLAPLYTAYGDAPLLVLEAADAIRAAARRQGYAEREVLTVLPQFDWNQLAAAGQNFSLFGGRKIIELRIPGGKPGTEGAAALMECCGRLSEDNLILITLPALEWKEEKTAWFAALRQAGILLRLNTPPLADLPNWIAGRLARQKQKADAESLRFIAERVEGNLLAAHQEIQKLALLYPAGVLEAERIRDAVLDVARYRLDDLREALLQGDIRRLSRTLEGLRQEGESAVLVLWAFCEEIRAAARIKAGLARGHSAEALFRELWVRGARQGQLRRAAERLSWGALRECLDDAARIDRQIKGIDASGSGDVWDSLMRLGLRMRAPPRARTRPS